MGRKPGSKNAKIVQGPLTNNSVALLELTKGILYSKSELINPDSVRGKASALKALLEHKDELTKKRQDIVNNLGTVNFLLQAWDKEEG